MKFLITGFEPFLDIKINPTESLVNELSKIYSQNLIDLKSKDGDKTILRQDIKINTTLLPVEFISSFIVLKEAIDKYKPDVVLSLGVASERSNIEFERIAINHQSLKKPDNTGLKPQNTIIHNSGPDGLFSNLKVDEIVDQINSNISEASFYQGLKVSNSAGTYVCNALMYKLLIDANENNYLAGFIHVPNKTDDESIQNLKSVLFKIINSILEVHS